MIQIQNEESFSEQNDTVTIRAYPFNDKGQIAVEFDTAVKICNWINRRKSSLIKLSHQMKI